MSTTLHPERVKAEIRMKHGTLVAFASASGLKSEQVRDYLRGRSSAARTAVADLLGVDADQLVLQRTAFPIRGTRTTRERRRTAAQVKA